MSSPSAALYVFCLAVISATHEKWAIDSTRTPWPTQASSMLQRKVTQSDTAMVTLVSVECSPYEDWQVLTLLSSWKRARIPGMFVRLLACPTDKRDTHARLTDFGDGMTTHLHEPTTTDYPPLNKPLGMLSWLTTGSGRELPDNTVVLMVDADMIFYDPGAREQLMPIVESVLSGSAKAVGHNYKYPLDGLKNTSWALPRHFGISDTSNLQGVGFPILLGKRSLNELAPRYLKFTQAIIDDPKLHALVHDGRQPAPWIAEMVGYTLAASELRHQTQSEWPVMDVPQPPYSPLVAERPLMVHYSHTFHLCGRVFGKRSVKDDLLNCSGTPSDLEELQPPSQVQVLDEACSLCMADGENFGSTATCFHNSGKKFALYAWEQVHDAVSSWRTDHCDATAIAASPL